MNPRRYAIAFAAGLALVVLGSWVQQRLWPAEWKAHQRAYNQLRSASGMEPIELGIRSIVAAGQEERCVTCHLGTVMQGFDTPPLQPHPRTACALPVQVQGCTGCHGGEPLRLTREGAHGIAPDARRALTDGTDRAHRSCRIQAGCATCHVSRTAGVLRYDQDKAPEVSAGMQVYLSQGCPACHRIAGVFNAVERGPSLTGIALRRSRGFLSAAVLSPRSLMPSSPMPPLVCSDEERQALLAFLEAQIGPEREPGCGRACAMQATEVHPGVLDHMDEPLPQTANPAAGAWWARKLGCRGCHRLASSEPGVPDLTRVGWYRSEAQLRTLLRDPSKQMPATFMPALNVPQPVFESIVAWLVLQKSPLPSTPVEVLRQVCRRCHGPVRDPKTVVLSVQPPRLDGRKATLPRDKFIEKASGGVEGTAMPPWGRMLGAAFLGAIHDALD